MVDMREPGDRFGVVEVRGLVPERGKEHAAALRAVLARSAVLCLRMETPLREAEFRSLARLFGPIKDPVGRTKDGSGLRYSEPRRFWRTMIAGGRPA
jgi:hypothetical protein